jgi:hypothetical protein
LGAIFTIALLVKEAIIFKCFNQIGKRSFSSPFFGGVAQGV